MAESFVTYRGRQLDLAPYLEGFPYVGFEALPEANLLLYFHDLPGRRLLKAQPFDPAIGRALNDIDWNLRSFGPPKFDRARNALLFAGDESNDEVFNVYHLALDTGAISKLTDVPYVYTFELSHDGSKLAYVARWNEQGKMRAELRIRDMATGEDLLIIADTPHLRFTWGRLLWSQDDSHILAPINVDDDRNRANLAWIDLAAPSLKPLLETNTLRSMLNSLKAWLDERTCLIVNNESGYMQVYRLDVRDGTMAPLTDEPYDYRSDLMHPPAATASVNGRVLVATVLDRPQDSPMRLFDVRTGETVWEHVEQGSVYLMNSGEKDLYATTTSLTEKWAPWHLRVGTSTIWEKIATMPQSQIGSHRKQAREVA